MSITGGIQGLHFVNTMNNQPLQAGAMQAKGIISGLGSSIKQIAPFAPIAAAGAIFTKLSSDAYEFSNQFSKSMREVQTISTAVQKDFEGISKQIVNLAAQGPDDAIKLSQAYYQIVSAGYDGAKGLELLNVSSKAATAGLTDTKVAADGLTTILNAWKKDASEAEKVTDILFKTVEKGKTTFPELASNIAQVAPIAAAMNISFEEIAGAIATLTKQGNTTPTALTQIRSAIIAMNDVLGDGWSKTMSFQEGLQKIRDMAGGSDTKLKNMMGRIEGMNAVLAMTGDKAQEAASDLDAMTTATGSMTSAYDKMMQEADNKWSMVNNKWQRELKDLGGALKIASGGIADFFNAMLTGMDDAPDKVPHVGGFTDRVAAFRMMGNSGLDSYAMAAWNTFNNQGVQNQLARTMSEARTGFDEKQADLASILGIEDAQEKAKKLNEFLNRMKQERSTDFNLFAEGDKKGELAAHLRTKYWNNLFSTIEDGLKGIKQTENDNQVTIIKPKTVSDAMARIKELQEKLGTESVEMDVELILQINAEQAFINDVAKQVREKLAEALSDKFGINLTDEKGTNTQIKGQPAKVGGDDKFEKAIKSQLAPMKTLTAEQQKQLELEAEKLDKLQEQQQIIEDLAQGLESSGRVLGALSFAVGEIDADLGRSVGRMADIAYNASDFVKNIGQGGNTVTAMTGAVGVIGNIVGMISQLYSSDKVSQMEALTQLYDIQTAAIEKQVKLLKQLEGDDRLKQEQKIREEQEEQLRLLNLRAQKADIETKNREKWMGIIPVWTKGFTYQAEGVEHLIELLNDPALKEMLAKGDIKISNMSELESIIRDYNTWLEAQENFEAGIKLDRLGFDTGTVAESIYKGIQDGLELSENGLGEWTQSFGELIKKALSQNILNALNNRFLTNFMDEFNKSMADGVLSDTDTESLTKLYIEAVTGAQDMWDKIQPVLSQYMGEDSAGTSGLTGAIRGITEETASLIAGQFTAMRFDMKDIGFSMADQLAVAEDSLQVLEDIRTNTSYNRHLEQIKNDISDMNRKIQQDF